MADLLAAGAGVVAGGLVAFVLLRRWALARARRRFEVWRVSELPALRRRAAGHERGDVKAAVGEDLRAGGPVGLAALPFEPADARFVGDPVTFVVFDGHTDVKDRAGAAVHGVSFVTVAPEGPNGGGPSPDADALLVAECVAGGRVEWLTARLP